MRLNIKFRENAKKIKPQFGEVFNISDGGYERGYNEGYAKGYEVGFTEGETKGNADGYKHGYSVGIVEGENNGYTKGYNEGYIKGYNEGIVKGREDGYNEGFAEGKQAEYDAFWDIFQENGNRRLYESAFICWSSGIFYPKYDIIMTESASGCFRLRSDSEIFDLVDRLTECGVTLDMSGATNVSWCFYNAPISRVPILDFSSGAALDYTFHSIKAHTIEGLKISEETKFNQTFAYASTLENITIEGTIGQNGLNLQWSTKLSKASIEIIINCLSTTTSGLSVTISKKAKEAAFTGDEWATLIATKPNWTINLV